MDFETFKENLARDVKEAMDDDSCLFGTSIL